MGKSDTKVDPIPKRQPSATVTTADLPQDDLDSTDPNQPAERMFQGATFQNCTFNLSLK